MKGKLFYFGLSLLLMILAQMISYVFYLCLIIYWGILLKMTGWKMTGFVIIITFLSYCLFRIPQPLDKEVIEGQIVQINENSVTVQNGYYKVKVYTDVDNYQMYDEVKMKIRLFETSPPTNDHAFHYQHYLYSLGIFNTASCQQVLFHKHVTHPYHLLEKRVNQSSQVKSFASLFVLGIKDEQMQEYYQKLTELSIIHMFALSGVHLHILKKWVSQILKFFCPKKMEDILSVVIIGLYIWVIPYNISFMRAFLVMLGNTFLKKYFNQLDILSIITIGMLFYNPYLIYNLSFLFSYFLYFAVIVLDHHIQSRYYLLLASLPIIIIVNNRINLFSFILSIILMPLIEWLYQAILYYLIFGNLIVPVLSCLIVILNNVVEFSHDFSVYIYFARPTLFFILAYYFYYFKGVMKLNVNRSCHKEVCQLLGILLAFYFYPYYNMQGKVVMIDVGQGDCFLIKQPFHQGNILIDTGGLKNQDVATTILIPYLYSEGIFSLDAVFISHHDFDHSGALESLQEHFNVKQVIEKSFDNMTIGDVDFECLTVDEKLDNENDNSLVIKAQIHHLNYLFTGDISEKVENALLAKYQHLDIDILKIPHHGSQTGTSNSLLKLTQPKVALISVGKNNMYGHPHQDVIERLKAYGIKVYRTDLQGMVEIDYYHDENNYIDIHHKDISKE